MESERVKTVIEDLIWLRDDWEGTISEASMRRGSTPLRRLLWDSEIHVARRELGIEGGGLRIEAPYVEPFIQGGGSSKVDFVLGGGGDYGGMRVAVRTLGRASSVPEPSGGLSILDCVEYDFTVQNYIDSIGIYVKGYGVSRRKVVGYVSNKLGGAHYDTDERDNPGFELLDSYRDQLVLERPGSASLDAVYFELLSIGQLLGQSRAAELLIRAARESDEVDL